MKEKQDIINELELLYLRLYNLQEDYDEFIESGTVRDEVTNNDIKFGLMSNIIALEQNIKEKYDLFELKEKGDR